MILSTLNKILSPTAIEYVKKGLDLVHPLVDKAHEDAQTIVVEAEDTTERWQRSAKKAHFVFYKQTRKIAAENNNGWHMAIKESTIDGNPCSFIVMVKESDRKEEGLGIVNNESLHDTLNKRIVVDLLESHCSKPASSLINKIELDGTASFETEEFLIDFEDKLHSLNADIYGWSDSKMIAVLVVLKSSIVDGEVL